MMNRIASFYKSFFILLVIVHAQVKPTIFATLTEASAYAQQTPERVDPDNNKNWIAPSFDNFYKKNRPTLFDRIKSWFYTSKMRFDIPDFKKMLSHMNRYRQKQGLTGQFGELIIPKKDDVILVWGDLLGAFHSLVRDLLYLQERSIINDSFTITNPHYYLIFNGNVLNGSPYILETLTLILRLMKQNPGRVFYTRGVLETNERWQNYSLARELKVRANQYSAEKIPCNGLLRLFFESLPLAVYIMQDSSEKRYITLVSNYENIKKYFAGDALSHVLDIDVEKKHFELKENVGDQSKKSTKKASLEAIIASEDRDTSFRLTEGLSFGSAFEGATEWFVFSSPTERNQTLYKFSYDAFAEITVTNGMRNWSIALINQSVLKPEGFQEAAIYNLVTGKPIITSQEAKKAKVYTFGSTMDLSKGASPIGKKVKEGLELAFNEEISGGSLKHIIPQLTTVDDEYNPTKSRTAVQDLIKNGITTLIGSQGSASLEAYLDLVKNGEILVLFPLTGSPLFRKPELKNLIHYRGSYIREGEELINYAINHLKAKKFAIFYQDDAFGRGALEGARRALKAAGISNYVEIPHERNVTDFEQQKKKILDANPDAILFSTNALPIRGLIRQMGVPFFSKKRLLGISVYEDAFEQFLKDKGLEFTLIRMVPDPETSDLPIAKEYRTWADKQNMNYDKVSFEQFINAQILFEILSHIKGPITNDKIIEIAEGFKHYQFKGLELTFNPETRELSDTLWIDDAGKGPWIKRTQSIAAPPDQKEIEKEHALELQGKKPLQFGTVVDLSKSIKFMGTEIQRGLEIRLKEAEAQGLKHIPSLVVENDEYTPDLTVKLIKELQRKGVNNIICPTGTPTLEAYLDLVKSGMLWVFFPITGATIFRDATLKNIIHLRRSYEMEAKILSQYALDTLRLSRLAILYQNDSFGHALLQGSKAEFQKRNFKDVIEIAYERNATDFKDQVASIKEYKPDGILFFATALIGMQFIREYDIRDIIKLKLLGNSDFAERIFQNYIRDTDLPFIFMSAVPNPENSDLLIVQQYRNAAKSYGATIDIFSLESYIAMDLVLYAIQNIQVPITQEKIMEQLMNFKGSDYKGLFLKFDPHGRSLMHSLWMYTGSSDWEEVSLSK